MKKIYKELIEKLNDEKEDLFIKICKLEKFIESDNYKFLPEYHQFLLKEQLMGMRIYLTSLSYRIKHIDGGDK